MILLVMEAGVPLESNKNGGKRGIMVHNHAPFLYLKDAGEITYPITMFMIVKLIATPQKPMKNLSLDLKKAPAP